MFTYTKAWVFLVLYILYATQSFSSSITSKDFREGSISELYQSLGAASVKIPVYSVSFTRKGSDESVTFSPSADINFGVEFGYNGYNIGIWAPLPKNDKIISQ